MSKADDTAPNWEPYEAEIISLYVHQNKTLEATMTHMREKCGFHATTKQYKTRFSGYKNLKASEWASVIHGVRKRALEGKESDVYLHDRRLDPKRVKTQMARYDSSILDLSTEMVDTSLQGRIHLQTPPPSSLLPDRSQASPAQHGNLDVDSGLFLDMAVDSNYTFGEFVGQIYQNSSPRFSEMSPLPRWNCAADADSEEIEMVGTPSFVENVDLDMLYHTYVELELTRNLPWFQFQNLMEQPGFISVNPIVNEVFRTSSRLTRHLNPFSNNGTDLALEQRHSLLSGFLNSTSKDQVVDYVPHFTFNLQRVIPERQEGELSKKVQTLFDPYNQKPLYQIFEIATYFSSNNMLTESQTDVFLRWIIDQKYTDRLQSFLKIETPTVQAFSVRILESGIRINDIKFLRLLLDSGVKFDKVLEQAMTIKDPELLSHLLSSQVDPNLLSGSAGGRLLYLIAGTNYTKIAQILIENGADVNLPAYQKTDKPILHRAVYHGNFDMIKCLLDAGADVDAYYNYYPTSALASAIANGRADIVLALLEKGADVNCGMIDKKSILEWAALYARKLYSILLQKTGRVDQPLMVGDILYAAEQGGRAFAKFLCHNEARISQMQLEKALKESIEGNKFRATSALLDNSVDPNGPNLKENERPLMMAALEDELKYSQVLLDAGADVNLPGLLKRAVEFENFELLDLLIESGSDLEVHGPEALETAVQVDRIDMAALLIDKGTAINAFGEKFTGLQAAGSVSFAQYLIDRGADVNAPASAERGRTALQAAAERGDLEMVAFLVRNRADVNAPPAQVNGLTALEAVLDGYGSMQEKREVFKLLLENGALINHPGSLGRRSKILHQLIEKDQEDLIHLVLEAGINVENMSSGNGGRRPLQLAAEKANLAVVKLLLEYGAEVNAPPGYRYGRTTLQAAASSGNATMELIQLLMDNNADIHACAGVTGGITALQGAAISGHIKIALMLLKMGADVNARPAIKEGRTAIEGAAEHGRLDMVQLLLNAGAKGDVIGATGFKTAIELAEKNRHFAITQILRGRQEDGGVSPVN